MMAKKHLRNLNPAALYELILARGEGELSDHGALVVRTGQHTGRSAKDKFIIRDADTEKTVWWDNTQSITRKQFETLRDDMMAYAARCELFQQDLFAGADPDYRMPVRIITQYGWHSLFIRNLLINPEESDLKDFTPECTIMDMPGFEASPERHGSHGGTIIACDMSGKNVLIAGTSYAGEIKKSVFTMLNYHLPPKGVMPMHCSVNVGKKKDSAVFFGLSGTGKTTLSADPDRTLIGDDEHGWSANGLFNFEGGCYAKTIRLSPEAEPEIFATTRRFGTVLENVAMDEKTRRLDLDDAALTENTRCAYPIEFIPNADPSGTAPSPATIIMLTADSFGILPPAARLDPAQAVYHFLSGYTARVAGTEKGVSEPEATFSTCFGAPFMPRHPAEYGALLRNLIAQHGVACWLVNTGWTGGPYGVGRRMPIMATRTLLSAILEGTLDGADMRKDPNFGFQVPANVPGSSGFDATLLDPRQTWKDAAAYDKQALALVKMFADNFRQFENDADPDVRAVANRQTVAA